MQSLIGAGISESNHPRGWRGGGISRIEQIILDLMKSLGYSPYFKGAVRANLHNLLVNILPVTMFVCVITV